VPVSVDSRPVGFNVRIAVALCQVATLSGGLALASTIGAAEDWRPHHLVALLMAFALLSELLTVDGRNLRISGSFIAIVLAMVTLGPVPAALIGLAGIGFDTLRARSTWPRLLTNTCAYATFPLIGGLVFASLEPMLADSALTRATAVIAVFLATNVLNFLLVAGPMAVYGSRSLWLDVRQVLLPLLPSQLATGVLTATVDFLYQRHGLTALAAAAVAALLFQHMLRVTMQSVDRAGELERRTVELAALQVGLVTTVLRTLSLRDKMTARHSAAVARYARELARELGLDPSAQETIHTAGLLHDIGKFAFPDDILLSSTRLTDEQFEIVKRHPEQGARLVRRLEGFEEVAEIIHAHHERVDGRGYPRRLTVDRIPIGSRIIAVCDTYDVMTARDSYRHPVSPAQAIAELRRVSGSQLDATVVEAFVEMIQRKGIIFHHNDDADFEAELDARQLVAEYARPRAA
jgi:putative nucleotidyltransferase with HDIG domain